MYILDNSITSLEFRFIYSLLFYTGCDQHSQIKSTKLFYLECYSKKC